MSTIDYKALAERLSRLADERASLIVAPHIADIRTVVTLLNGMADEKPIYFVISGDSWVEVSKEMQARHGTKWQRTLYTRPEPQPQPQRQYYYRRIECAADYATDPDCICWHDEGTGPLSDGTAKAWREKPAPQPQPEQPQPAQPHKSFMGQFQAAREEVAQLRDLMGESARVATLTFPAPQPERQPVSDSRVCGRCGWHLCEGEQCPCDSVKEPVSEPTEAHPMLCATHYCKDCAALWRQCDDFSFTLRSQACCTACNNAPVGGQLFALTTPVAMPRPSEPTEAQIERLHNALVIAAAALADIGDADREPGDDLAWCEQRAAEALPTIRAALAAKDAK